MANARLKARPTWLAPLALAVALTMIAVSFARGWGYYHLEWNERFEHQLHRTLRSSGSLGHLYAKVGFALILGNLLYLIRRRLVHAKFLGSMRAWMHWHVFSGITGPALILLHSALVLRTWPAIVSSVSLMIVVSTGIFGRYLYRMLPRGPDGRPSSSEETAGAVDRALMELRGLQTGGIAAATLVELRVERAIGAVDQKSSNGLRAVLGTLRAQGRLRGLARDARDVAVTAGAEAAEARTIGRRASAIGRMVLRADTIDTIAVAASSWRSLHRNLVMVMLLAASLHVSIAVYVGFW